MKPIQPGYSTGRIGVKDDKDLTNAEKIIFNLKAKKHTISTAESMSAGSIGYGLTRVPGSSNIYIGGLVVYTRESKKLLLGLPDSLLDSGLVTHEITLAMAKAVMKLFGTDYGVGVTGNAGPTANDEFSSVGRVYFAVADYKGNEMVVSDDFFGNRDAVREKATTEGLRAIRNFLEKYEEGL